MNQFQVRISQVDVGHVEAALESVKAEYKEVRHLNPGGLRELKAMHNQSLRNQIKVLKKIIRQTDAG